MITISKNTLLLLYFGAFLFLCFGAWLLSHSKARKKTLLPPISTLHTCEYCTFQYLADTGKSITTCPQCGSYNKEKIL